MMSPESMTKSAIFPGSSDSLYFLLKRGIGARQGPTPERFFAAHALDGKPSTLGRARPVLPGDGGVESQQWIGLFDREVRSIRNRHAQREKPLPGIGALDALRTQARFGPAHVAGGMRRLHLRSHASGIPERATDPSTKAGTTVTMPRRAGRAA